MRLSSKKAQSTLEYAIIIFVVIGALLAIQIYVKRAIQGKLRSSADSIGEQYSAGITTSTYTTTTDSEVEERISPSGVTTTTYRRNVQERTGSETVDVFSAEPSLPSQ